VTRRLLAGLGVTGELDAGRAGVLGGALTCTGCVPVACAPLCAVGRVSAQAATPPPAARTARTAAPMAMIFVRLGRGGSG
jgi:hypothetical protein